MHQAHLLHHAVNGYPQPRSLVLGKVPRLSRSQLVSPTLALVLCAVHKTGGCFKSPNVAPQLQKHKTEVGVKA